MLIAHMIFFGLWVGITPLGLLCEGIVMSGEKPRRNGTAFLAGWLLVLVIVMFIGATALHHPQRDPESTPTLLITAITTWVGVALLIIGIRLRRRPKGSSAMKEPPSWVNRLGDVGVFGAILAGLAVPSYPPTLAAGAELARTADRPVVRMIAIGIFLAAGCLFVAPPVFIAYKNPERVQEIFDGLQMWIRDHWVQLLSIALISLGALLVISSSDDVVRAVM